MCIFYICIQILEYTKTSSNYQRILWLKKTKIKVYLVLSVDTLIQLDMYKQKSKNHNLRLKSSKDLIHNLMQFKSNMDHLYRNIFPKCSLACNDFGHFIDKISKSFLRMSCLGYYIKPFIHKFELFINKLNSLQHTGLLYSNN